MPPVKLHPHPHCCPEHMPHLVGPHPKLVVLAECKEKGIMVQAMNCKADGHI